nr:hypothetical protein [uncultured Dysosmobacter sp.]
MKRFKDYPGNPVGFLKRGDEIDIALAMSLTEQGLGSFEEYREWDRGIIQNKYTSDIVADVGIYETIIRHNKYSPFIYLGQCERGAEKNENPALSRKIYVCSAYRSDDPSIMIRNVNDAMAECRKIAMEGDIPICPHLYFPQFLNEADPRQRAFGMQAGLEVLRQCDEITVLIRERISEGMDGELRFAANELGLPLNTKYLSETEKR